MSRFAKENMRRIENDPSVVNLENSLDARVELVQSEERKIADRFLELINNGFDSAGIHKMMQDEYPTLYPSVAMHFTEFGTASSDDKLSIIAEYLIAKIENVIS